MASALVCADCGALLPEHAPGNRCPKCLLEIGLEEVVNEPGTAEGSQKDSQTPLSSAESESIEEQPGTVIGRYKLLQRIGEGGFGVVFMAEQMEPVQRKVALKVIKAGMDSREIIARFEAERQALALMDHPNIARVLDGGATASRRPYFVMELVQGIPITDYCDQANLSTRERLQLFIQVCRAIQHAHQKGIIHRDLKPGNILVALHDGEPVPKVIDFGVAKALGQKLTEKTLFTRFEQMIGTPAYMSPEQATGGLDADTRSDIYSLGVLLYELLTGVTPLDGEILRKGMLDEVRRMIRETDPPKPSTRLQSMGGRLAEVARSRQADPATLNRLIRGDLDWITMKALEKDRQRRYETVNGLAVDLERHLNNEPVMARPPSRLYEFQKSVRRHKFGFAATGAVIAALAFGLVATSWQSIRARREKQKAQSEAVKSQQVARFLEDMLQGVAPSVARGRDTTMLREILDRTAERVAKELKDQPLVAAELQQRVGGTYVTIHEFTKGEHMQRQALETRRKLVGNHSEEVAYSLMHLAVTLRIQKQLSEAESLDREALVLCRKLYPSGHGYLAKVLGDLARVLEEEGKFDEAEALVQEGLGVLRKIPGDHREDIAEALWHLGHIRRGQGRIAEAEQLMSEQLPTIRQLGVDDTLAWSLGEVAFVLMEEGKLPQAEAAFKEALSIERRIYKDVNQNYIAGTLRDMSALLVREGKYDEAEPLQQEALSLLGKIPGDQRLDFARGMWQLAKIRRAQGKNAAAEKIMTEQLSTLRELETKAGFLWCPEELAWVLKEQNKLSQAEEAFRETLSLRRAFYGQNHRFLINPLLGLSECLAEEGKPAEAEREVRAALEIQAKLATDEKPNPELMEWIGNVLQKIGDNAEALEWYRKSLLAESTARQVAPHKYSEMVNVFASLLLRERRFTEIDAASEEWLREMRTRLPADDPELAELLARLALSFFAQEKFENAEQLARECVAIREKKLPDDWRMFEARSMLGGCLLAEKRYAEAEPLLLSGWEGLTQHEAQIPTGLDPRAKKALALNRLVQLNDALSRAEQATEWRKKLEELDSAAGPQTSARADDRKASKQ